MNDRVREVGERIRSSMPLGGSQQDLARRVGMTPDALSRALNGQRGFAAFEIADIADALGVETHWLITGHRSPHTVTVAARHDWDPHTRTRSNPGREFDDAELENVVSAYRETYPDGPSPSRPLPASAAEARSVLGGGFVRDFAQRLTDELGVDVIRIPGLSTDYSMTIGGRAVIVLTSTTNWFRNNWSAAHELGHLALGHHEYGVPARDEPAANSFAADLLLPTAEVRGEDWSQVRSDRIADRLWEWGVSTQALSNRLASLGIEVGEETRDLLATTTQSVLRGHLRELKSNRFLVAQRETGSRGRLFPEVLIDTLTERVASGSADASVLAWVQDVPIEDIDYPEPDVDAVPPEFLAALDAPTDFGRMQRYLDGVAGRTGTSRTRDRGDH